MPKRQIPHDDFIIIVYRTGEEAALHINVEIEDKISAYLGNKTKTRLTALDFDSDITPAELDLIEKDLIAQAIEQTYKYGALAPKGVIQ